MSVCVVSFPVTTLRVFDPYQSTAQPTRALLVDEVTYEPSSRLKKSRKAVVLITGADLVLVKMTSMTKANNSGSSSSGSGTAGNPDAAAVGSASGGVSTAAAAAAAGASIGSGAGGRTSVDAAAAVAADARASVLAQHELNKVCVGVCEHRVCWTLLNTLTL